MRRLLAAALVGSGVFLAFFTCCSGPDREVAGRADADALTDGGVPTDHSTQPAEADATFTTAGWVRLDYPNCELYAAPSADRMPAPLAWGACSSIVEPLGVACRQITPSWQAPSSGGDPGIALVDGWVGPNGKAWLAVLYNAGAYAVETVSEADGVVRQAVSSLRGGCSVTTGRLASTKSIWMVVRPKSASLPEERGAIGGDVEAVPAQLEHWADGAARSYYAGPVSYFALGPGNAIRAWTPGKPALGQVTLSDPGQISARTFVGPELFFEVSDQSYGRVKVYSPENGARDLISFGNDVSKRAVNFGTDGVDMVWVEAFGRAAVGEPWTTIEIMTAKYTSDAGTITKRRLRSEGSAVGVDPFTVGCGYAAHYVSTSTDGNFVRVIRLSDGRSWKLPEVIGDGGAWFFQTPYAITCDEIFLNVSSGGQSNVARVRLDSLGAGDPAD